MTGVLSLAGLGLVGVGAHAVFTTSTSSVQTVNAGTPLVVTWSPAATNGCTSAAIAAANPVTCQSVTLPTVGPVGSTFDSASAAVVSPPAPEVPPTPVYVDNIGNILVTEAGMQLTDTTNGTNGNYLQDEMDICISSDPHSGGSGLLDGATIVANGPLTTGTALTPSVTLIGPPLPAFTGTDEYQVDFYAGQNSAECGTTWSDGGHTASAWSGAPYPTVYPWVTPASLTPPAEGGSVTVTLTLSYNG
jgi:hypothetical protein